MSSNPFVLPAEQYVRFLDPIGDYIRQAGMYLSVQTNTDYNKCCEFVARAIKQNGVMPAKPPRIKYTERKQNGDREIKVTTTYAYIKDALQSKDLLAPTFTRYVNHETETSLLVNYAEGNIAKRSKYKKMMFRCKADRDMAGFIQNKNRQNNRKLGNNALSGTFVSAFNVLHNKTAHNTLTSNCRSTSGYGNANNEKMLSGNRHYHTPDIVFYNITAIITITDLAEFENLMLARGFVYPTVDDVMDCIMFSFRLYNRDVQWEAKFKAYVNRLTAIQRAAFLYVGDLYQVAKHNPAFVREFFSKMISRKHAANPSANMAALHSHREDSINLAAQVINNDLRGKKHEDIQGTYLFEELLATTSNIENTADEYSDFIKAIFVTRNMPASLGYFPDSIRRSALTSDTDSTIFTVQDWVKWYCGSITFTDEAMGIAALMIWFSTQTIIHLLAMMCANFGIPTKYIFRVAMKNEFKFDVFVPTSRSKHYYALISCQEGQLNTTYEKEVKGVHLKSSNCPAFVNKAGEDMMLYIMNTIVNGELISIEKCISDVISVERRVHKEILAAEPAYFRRGSIKTLDSYSDKRKPHETNYVHYMMWQEVFAPKYGNVIEPPYDVTKVSVDLLSPVKVRAWLLAMEDRDMAHRFETFLNKYGKKQLGTLLIPRHIVKATGMPAELTPVIGVRDMVKDITGIFKLIMETVGMRVGEDYLFYENY